MSYKPIEPRCRLVVDSGCDVPRSILDDAGVDIVDFRVRTQTQGEIEDDMWVTLSPADFYKRMRDGEDMVSSQVPMSDYVEIMNKYAEAKEPAVYLCFSSALSGSCSTAQLVADQVRAAHPDAELYVVDAKLASIAEGVLVLGAVRQRARGLSAAELAAWAEEAKYYAHGYFTIDSLHWLKKGGRIPPVIANVATKLDIKPILSFDLDGNLTSLSMVRGRRKSLKALEDLFVERSVDASRTSVIIGTADAEKDGDFLEERIGRHGALHSVVRPSMGPLIGTHVGPGMVAIAFWGPDRRHDISIADRIANAIKSDSASRKADALKAEQDAMRIAHEAGYDDVAAEDDVGKSLETPPGDACEGKG